METLLGMEVKQPGKEIRKHLDNYIQEALTDYKAYIKKSLFPNDVGTCSDVPRINPEQ